MLKNLQQNLRFKEKFTIFVLAGFLPLTFTLLWLVRNTQLPGNDASNYLMTAINIYQQFVDKGFLRGLWHFYIDRGWRPIFFPNLSVPFLLISHGNLFFAYWALACINLLATTTYVYLFFRLQLDRISSIIASNLVGLLPLIQAQIVMFYAEGTFFFCFLGSIYHLIKSDYFRNAKHAYGFALLLTLAMILRPVEAVTQGILVILCFITSGWIRGIFKSRQILTLLLFGFLALICFLLFAARPYLTVNIFPNIDDGGPLDVKMAKILFNALIVSLTCVLLILVFLGATSNRLIKQFKSAFNYFPLLSTFLLVLVPVLIWFAPAAFETYQWIFRTSIGDVALSTGSLSGSQFSLSVMNKYLHAEGLAVIFITLLLAILSALDGSKNSSGKLIFSLPVMYMLLTIPFPLWESFYTVQIVTRKLAFAFPAFIIAMLIIGLRQGRCWTLRLSIATLLTAFQFSLLINLICTNTYSRPNAFLANTLGYFIPQPVTMFPNPHDVVINFLTQQAINNNLQYIGLEVQPGSPDARHHVSAQPIDPFLLSTMVLSSSQKYSTSYPYFSFYTDKSLKDLNQRYDAIFISDHVENMVVSNNAFKNYKAKFLHEKNQSIKVYYDFLMRYAENQLSIIGWSLGPCTIIKTENNGNFLGCIAINSLKNRALILNA